MANTTGLVTGFRAGVKAEFPHIDQLVQQTLPYYRGNVKDFCAANGNNKKVIQQLTNVVKACPHCGKANAYLLDTCNACGGDLTNVKTSKTDNIFTSFIFGIEKGRFPYSISIRHQSENFLVFDDLMAASPCHVNCIPTDVYVPDLRSLFEQPKKGLALVKKMATLSWEVVKQCFLSNDVWRKFFFAHSSEENGLQNNFDAESWKKYVIMGMNFPPSQYQLHLQVILPPFTPKNWYLYNEGVHFTRGRFVPLEFLLPALEVTLQTPIANASSGDINTIFKSAAACGVNYDEIYEACYKRYGKSHITLAKWSSNQFSTVIIDGKDIGTGDDAGPLLKTDKMAISSYGSPHVDGKFTRQYYKFASRATVPLPSFT